MSVVRREVKDARHSTPILNSSHGLLYSAVRNTQLNGTFLMLAEIAACSAAFQVIKGALANGKELYDVADQAATFFNGKSVIAKKAKKGGSKNELQNFMALEKIKADEAWLREWMIYAGRPDMFSDWQAYQVECRKNRERAAAIKARRRADTFALLWTCLLWGTGGLVILPVAMYVAFRFFGIV